MKRQFAVSNARRACLAVLLLTLGGCYKQVETEAEGYKGSTNTTLIKKYSKTNAAKLWLHSNKIKSNLEKNEDLLCPASPKCKTQQEKLRHIQIALEKLKPIKDDKTNFQTIHYSYIINGNIPWPKRVAYCIDEQIPPNTKSWLLPATRSIDRAFLAHQGSAPPEQLINKLDKIVCKEFRN